MQKIDFDDLPVWAEFVAQDEDGSCWAYGAHPNKHHYGWYEKAFANSAFGPV